MAYFLDFFTRNNTYYTIKDRYWIHNMLQRYKDIFPHVKHANNKNRKEVRFLTLTQGFSVFSLWGDVMCGYTPLTIRETETLTSNGLYI